MPLAQWFTVLPTQGPPTGTTASSWKQTEAALKFQLFAAFTPLPKFESLSACAAGAAKARAVAGRIAIIMIFFMYRQRRPGAGGCA